ncbi:hypothetical protein FOTG_19259, partial [Fusarium oxysporum f. sp. vasinfectum 25433]
WLIATTFATAEGINYRRYQSNYSALTHNANFTPSYFKISPVLALGSVTSINFSCDGTLKTEVTLPTVLK